MRVATADAVQRVLEEQRAEWSSASGRSGPTS